MTRQITLLLLALLLAALGGRGPVGARRLGESPSAPGHRPPRPLRHEAATDGARTFANELSPATVEGAEEGDDDPPGTGPTVALLPPDGAGASGRDRGTTALPARPAGLRRPLRC